MEESHQIIERNFVIAKNGVVNDGVMADKERAILSTRELEKLSEKSKNPKHLEQLIKHVETREVQKGIKETNNAQDKSTGASRAPNTSSPNTSNVSEKDPKRPNCNPSPRHVSSNEELVGELRSSPYYMIIFANDLAICFDMIILHIRF